jgi:hypothetical protein
MFACEASGVTHCLLLMQDIPSPEIQDFADALYEVGRQLHDSMACPCRLQACPMLAMTGACPLDSPVQIWGRLTRQVSPNVSANPDLYTMLPVPNPFVVPGARFREAYYWDS